MVQVDWKGKMAFGVTPPSGNKFVLDAHPDSGGEDGGPTPVEAMLASLAACTAMDVISILQKKRQKITGYRVEVEGDRPPIGEWPRPFRNITIKHIFEGENLDPLSIARAIQLSDGKYCTVMATLRENPNITTSWEIAELSGISADRK